MIERIVWINVDTTGDDVETDKILQVSSIVTDSAFHRLGSPFKQAVYYNVFEVAKLKMKCDPILRWSYDEIGLWDVLPFGTELNTVSYNLLKYVKSFVSVPGSARLAGRDIVETQGFLKKNIPTVLNYLNPSVYDLNSVSTFFNSFVKTVVPFDYVADGDYDVSVLRDVDAGRYYADFLENGYPPF